MRHILWPASLALAAAFAGGPASSQPRQSFDGTWLVTIVCDASREGDSYRIQFPATVHAGLLHAQRGTPGQFNSLALDGEIAPDGTAAIRAQGLTGLTRYNLNHAAEGTPFHYTLQTRFAGTQGFGHRLEDRPCTASFTKQ